MVAGRDPAGRRTAAAGGYRNWIETDPALLGVSCVAIVGCTAVGAQGNGSFGAPIAQSQPGAPVAETEPPALPAVQFGRSADVASVSGTVLIKLPGASSFVPLASVQNVPLGTVIDTTRGSVRLTSASGPGGATQSGTFSEGLFRISQKGRQAAHKSLSGSAELTLVGPLASGCRRGKTSRLLPEAKARPRRRLLGEAQGNFSSVAHYASATVRDPKWLVEDTCEGTVIKVYTGVVVVDDFPHRRLLRLRAPSRFLAHPGRADDHRRAGVTEPHT